MLEVLDPIPDILGDRAAAALIRYAAESTVAGRLGRAPHAEEDLLADALAIASRVSQHTLRMVARKNDSWELEATPAPAVAGLRRALALALCQGSVEAALKATLRVSSLRAEATERPDGRIRILVRRR
jgi:hypothetical protein